MAKPIVSDELWAVIEPLLPASKPQRLRYPGANLEPVTTSYPQFGSGGKTQLAASQVIKFDSVAVLPP